MPSKKPPKVPATKRGATSGPGSGSSTLEKGSPYTPGGEGRIKLPYGKGMSTNAQKRPSVAQSRTPRGVTSGTGSGASTRGAGHYVGRTGKALPYTPGGERMRDSGAGTGAVPKYTRKKK